LNAEGESYDLSLLDPQNIEKIEIIKNNASVYGGGAAIGGVVMITSRSGRLAQAPQYRAGIEVGSFGYAEARLSFKGNLGALAYRLAMSKFNADNDFKYEPGSGGACREIRPGATTPNVKTPSPAASVPGLDNPC
jgi:outer membrane receptor protein involved in Fe transport